MTIEISQTTLYIVGAVLSLIIVFTFCIIIRRTKGNGNNASKNGAQSTTGGKLSSRQEAKRREQAAKRIEAGIASDLEEQKSVFKSYIANLKSCIGETDKKTFFKLTRYTKTEPSGLFDVLRRVFNISNNDTVYYCRRNSTFIGADDYFIITNKGFSFGDSDYEKWTLRFEWLTHIENRFDCVLFCIDDDSQELRWEYVLYYCSEEECADFVELTNRFLKKYRTEEDILIDAALLAADEKARPLLSRLVEQLGVDSPKKMFVRASYYYVLAEDNVNAEDNLKLCNYDIQEVEKKIREYCEEEGCDIRGSFLYGMCGILKAKIAMLSGKENPFDIEQSLKELMGQEYDQSVRDEAAKLITELKCK